MDFWHKASNTILFTFQSIVLNQFRHLCIHTYMFIWMKNLIQMFFVKSHEWNFSYKIEMGHLCNIWLNTSSHLVIVWMVFEVYLHFAIYCDNYNFLMMNIFFKHLLSISKWVFFLYNLILLVLNYIIPNTTSKKPF
jgi:hypothetical protein